MCVLLLKYFCRHVYCFHAIVHAFVALPHLSVECSFFFLAHCNSFGSFLYYWFHPLREFRAPLNLIVFRVCECVFVDFLLKMYKIRVFNSDADAVSATTAVYNQLYGVGFKFQHADLISSVCLSLYTCTWSLWFVWPWESRKNVTMELCLRLCNENVRSLNNVFFFFFC